MQLLLTRIAEEVACAAVIIMIVGMLLPDDFVWLLERPSRRHEFDLFHCAHFAVSIAFNLATYVPGGTDEPVAWFFVSQHLMQVLIFLGFDWLEWQRQPILFGTKIAR